MLNQNFTEFLYDLKFSLRQKIEDVDKDVDFEICNECKQSGNMAEHSANLRAARAELDRIERIITHYFETEKYDV